MRFRPATHAIYLTSYHSGLTSQAVAVDTGCPLDAHNTVETPIPTSEESRILREVVAPKRVFLR